METEDLVLASTADLVRELVSRLTNSNGVEFVPTQDLRQLRNHINAEFMLRDTQ